MTSDRRMTPRQAHAITILSKFLVCFIGGIIIGAIFLTPVISNLLGNTFSPMAITSIEVILACFVIGSILGIVTGGIVPWNREAIDGQSSHFQNHNVGRSGTTNPRDGYEDLEANRGSSIPSRPCPYQYYGSYDAYHAAAYENAHNHGFHNHGFHHHDSSESPAFHISYDPDIQPFRRHYNRRYALTEANLSRHNRNIPHDRRPSSPASSVRSWYEHRWAPNLYIVALDLDDGNHDADAEHFLSRPVTTGPGPNDRSPLLQSVRRGPRYS